MGKEGEGGHAVSINQDARDDRRDTRRRTFTIQTKSHQTMMRSMVVVVVVLAVVVGTVGTVAVAAGFGLHQCEDTPLGQGSPIPGWSCSHRSSRGRVPHVVVAAG